MQRPTTVDNRLQRQDDDIVHVGMNTVSSPLRCTVGSPKGCRQLLHVSTLFHNDLQKEQERPRSAMSLRGVRQLKELLIRYSDYDGSSKGIRDWIRLNAVGESAPPTRDCHRLMYICEWHHKRRRKDRIYQCSFLGFEIARLHHASKSFLVAHRAFPSSAMRWMPHAVHDTLTSAPRSISHVNSPFLFTVLVYRPVPCCRHVVHGHERLRETKPRISNQDGAKAVGTSVLPRDVRQQCIKDDMYQEHRARENSRVRAFSEESNGQKG
jgi:hypothetical protein